MGQIHCWFKTVHLRFHQWNGIFLHQLVPRSAALEASSLSNLILFCFVPHRKKPQQIISWLGLNKSSWFVYNILCSVFCGWSVVILCCTFLRKGSVASVLIVLESSKQYCSNGKKITQLAAMLQLHDCIALVALSQWPFLVLNYIVFLSSGRNVPKDLLQNYCL